ncbi:MAG: cell envelope integrity protein CreD [Betaproteobacteria bacterium]|nr:MAG: cell envelope integrity protein CreD [Betaproteobacteria bacterium]
MKFGIVLKALSLAFVIVLLMVGVSRIGNIAHERSAYRQQAVESVRKSLAGSQTIAGVVLTRACTETVESITEVDKKRQVERAERSVTLRALPQSIDMSATSDIEPRYRGLYKVNSFNVVATTRLDWNNLAELQSPRVRESVVAVKCDVPQAEFSISDPRGIRSIKLSLGSVTLRPEAMTEGRAFRSGFAAKLPLDDQALANRAQMTLELTLVGTESLAFVPLANENTIGVKSSWPHPSFVGAFLPTERTVQSDGFTAKWAVSSLASTARAGLARGAILCNVARESESDFYSASVDAAMPERAPASAPAPTAGSSCLQAFGVSFIDPINPATLADRATKYAFLFIALTFVGIVLLEVMKGARVHPIQYFLIGAALAVFFLLLISLSEHLNFALAYALAAVGCVAVIGMYASAVLGGWSRALPTMLGLGALYGVLFVVLQSEQHALLAGSLLIFASLAAVMLLTRNVEWHSLADRVNPKSRVNAVVDSE